MNIPEEVFLFNVAPFLETTDMLRCVVASRYMKRLIHKDLKRTVAPNQLARAFLTRLIANIRSTSCLTTNVTVRCHIYPEREIRCFVPINPSSPVVIRLFQEGQILWKGDGLEDDKAQAILARFFKLSKEAEQLIQGQPMNMRCKNHMAILLDPEDWHTHLLKGLPFVPTARPSCLGDVRVGIL